MQGTKLMTHLAGQCSFVCEYKISQANGHLLSTLFIGIKNSQKQEQNMNESTIVTSTVSTTGNENQTRPALYHYTAGWEKIVAILTTKVIFKESKYYEGQATAVWLSANPVWENTVMKIKGGLREHAEKLGAFRIKVLPGHGNNRSQTGCKLGGMVLFPRPYPGEQRHRGVCWIFPRRQMG